MAISIVSLGTGAIVPSGTTAITSSVSPSANKLQLLTIVVNNSNSVTPAISSVTGNGLTWVQVNSVQHDTGNPTLKSIFLYRAMGASPSAGAITVTFVDTNYTNLTWMLDEVSGVSTSGTNGSGAVVQSATNKTETTGSTVLSSTLGSFATASGSIPKFEKSSSAVNTSNGTTLAVTINGVLTGSTLVFAAQWQSGDLPTTVSDGINNFTLRGSRPNGDGQSSAVYTLDNVTSGNKTVTMTLPSGASYKWAYMAEVSGCDTNPFVGITQQWQSSPGTSANGITSSTLNSVPEGSILLGITFDTDGSTSYSAGTGYTYDRNVDPSNVGGASEYRTNVPAGNYAATFTQTDGNSAITHIIALKGKPSYNGTYAVFTDGDNAPVTYTAGTNFNIISQNNSGYFGVASQFKTITDIAPAITYNADKTFKGTISVELSILSTELSANVSSTVSTIANFRTGSLLSTSSSSISSIVNSLFRAAYRFSSSASSTPTIINAQLTTGNTFSVTTKSAISTVINATLSSPNIYAQVGINSVFTATFDTSNTISVANKLQQAFAGTLINVTTGTHSPGSNKLQLLSITTKNSLSTGSITPTVTGNSLTWVLVNKGELDISGATRRTQFLFRALGTSPIPGTIFIDFGTQVHSDINVILDEASNTSIAGTNGSEAIVQSNVASQYSSGTLTPSVTLATFNSIFNSTYGSFGVDSASPNVTVGAEFTQVSNVSSVLNSITEFKTANTTTVPINIVSTTDTCGIAVELRSINSLNLISGSASSVSSGSANLLAYSISAFRSAVSTGTLSLNTSIKLAASESASTTVLADLRTNDFIQNILQETSNIQDTIYTFSKFNSNPFNILLVSISSNCNITPSIPIISGKVTSWTQISTIASGTSRLTLFIGYRTITNNESITVDFSSQLQNSCTINIEQVSNVLLTGTNAINSIQQFGSHGDSSLVPGISNDITLSSLSNSNNKIYVVHSNSELSTIGISDPNYQNIGNYNAFVPTIISQYSTTDTTPSVSWVNSGYINSIAVELVYNKNNTAYGIGISQFSDTQLTTSIRLNAIRTATSTLTGSMAASSNIVGSASAISSVTNANISSGAVLAGSVSARTNLINSAISTQIKLAASASTTVAIKQADIRAIARLTADIGNNSTAQASTLATSIRLSAFAAGISTIVGTVTKLIPLYNNISADIQLLNPSVIIDMYEIDTQSLPGGGFLRFHSGINELNANIVWNGNTYSAYPIEVSGFEYSSDGPTPRPKITVANVSGMIGQLANENGDLIGLKVTRRRTFKKYLDAVNFPNGINPSADPNAHFADEIYFIDRKSVENKLIVEFELASALDLQGISLPRRQVLSSVCSWKYRSAECGYTGPAVATIIDEVTVDSNLDMCGKRIVSCKFRFGEGVLPYGGFPAVGKIG